MTLKPAAWVDPDKFIKQIADAGYAARKDDIRLTLTGKVTKEGDKLFLTVDDVKPGPQKFLLLQGMNKNEKQAKDRSDAYQAVSSKAGEIVELEGLWKPADTKKDKQALPSLSIIRVIPAKSAE